MHHVIIAGWFGELAVSSVELNVSSAIEMLRNSLLFQTCAINPFQCDFRPSTCVGECVACARVCLSRHDDMEWSNNII